MVMLRCYAVGRGDEWEAVCLDLCLAVQGTGFEDVRQRLQDSIEEHFDFLESLPTEDRESFLKRRAPFSQYLEFYLIALRTIFRRDRHNRHDGGGGEERFPLFCWA